VILQKESWKKKAVFVRGKATRGHDPAKEKKNSGGLKKGKTNLGQCTFEQLQKKAKLAKGQDGKKRGGSAARDTRESLAGERERLMNDPKRRGNSFDS